jgi:hypothetical protein
VDGGAVEAEEDAVGDGGPGGVLSVAVEAHLYEGGGVDMVRCDLGAGGGPRSRAGQYARTLFSGLALRRRKTAFLSVKASKAVAMAGCRRQSAGRIRCAAKLGSVWAERRSGAGGELTGRAGSRAMVGVEEPTNHRRRERRRRRSI